jgi:hypothetical protein
MKVTFFDAENEFKQLASKGVDFDWYKNDDTAKATANTSNSLSRTPTDSLTFQKKFVILKDSSNICFDNGEGRVQVYNWHVE